MRLSKIGYDDGKTRHYTWEPFGYGCSQDCMAPRKCWAEIQAARQRKNCPDCADFKVHFHPERLEQPAKTKKPGVVLVGFHADLFDEQRAPLDITNTLLTAAENPQHNYVFLTKNAERMRDELDTHLGCAAPNWYFGLTIRNQQEADARLPVFLRIPTNLWLSLEPLCGALRLREYVCVLVEGIIVGHDNKYGAPGTDTLDHIRSIVQQCEAASVNCYVKQIWVHMCPLCGRWSRLPTNCPCTNDWPETKPRFLRASHPDEYALYPGDLKLRNLPWRMPNA